MLYRVYTPAPELADIVVIYWYSPIAANLYKEQLYATPLFEGLVFNFANLVESRESEGRIMSMDKTAYILGQTRSYTRISGCHRNGGYIIGVRFKPLGLAKITGINMTHLTDHAIDAEDVWSGEMKLLYEAMDEAKTIESSIAVLENFLKNRRRIVRVDSRLHTVAAAISIMERNRGNLSCQMLQGLTNTTKKTMERNFMNYHGMKPKTYLRIIRFNFARRAMEHSLKTNLTELAHHLGYFDQSHFIKDFKRFSGGTPTEYLKIIEEEHKKRSIPID